MEKIRDFCLPSGNLFEPEELDAEELSPGDASLAAKWAKEAEAAAEDAAAAMASISKALEPQVERAKANEKREKEAAEKRAKDAPFKVWLAELGEILGSLNSDESDGRNEVEFCLYHLKKPDTGPQKAVLLHKFARTPEEAVNEGFPDLEKITLETAKEKGLSGTFRWNIRAWLQSEMIKSTTLTLSIAPQPGAEERKDPMTQITETLSMMKMIREAVGAGPAPAPDASAAQSAALLARLESMEKHRAELRDLEDRFERKLKAETADAYARGKVDGEKDARMALERKIWELERDLERAEIESPKADMVDKVVSMIGGPGAVQGLLAKLMTASPARPRPQHGPQPNPQRPPMQPRPLNVHEKPREVGPVTPNPTPAPTPAPMPEPTPEAVSTALAMIEEAKMHLEGSSEIAKPDIQALARALGECAQDGRAATGERVAEWWAWINEPTFPHTDGRKLSMLELAAFLNLEAPEPDEDDDEEEMSIDELKALLRERLEEGKAPGEILEECRELVSPETLDEWRGYLKFMPTSGALAFLGIPEHLSEQGAAVLEAFKA